MKPQSLHAYMQVSLHTLGISVLIALSPLEVYGDDMNSLLDRDFTDA